MFEKQIESKLIIFSFGVIELPGIWSKDLKKNISKLISSSTSVKFSFEFSKVKLAAAGEKENELEYLEKSTIYIFFEFLGF